MLRSRHSRGKINLNVILMKKSLKFLLAAALIVVAVSASAQFGIKVGYVNSATKFKAEDISVKPENQNGFYAGFHYDIATPVTGLSVRPGLFYTYIGGESVFEGMIDLGGYGVKLKDRDHTLSVPLDLKYAYNVTDDFKIYAFAGPRFAVGLVYQMKMNCKAILFREWKNILIQKENV